MEGSMKLKKSWIFWICYYGIAIMGNVLAAVLLRDKWNFNGWSAFPIGYIALCLFFIVVSPSNFFDSWLCNHYIAKLSMLDMDTFDEYAYLKGWNDNYETRHAHDLVVARIFAVALPPLLMFVLFFNLTAKILSGFFPLAAIIYMGYIEFHEMYLELKKEREQTEQALKEQKQREELGKWK